MSEINYACSVVQLGQIVDHPSADRLKLTTIYGNTVIIGLDSKEGDIGLFFPLESQIGEEFAKANDLLRRKDETGKTVGGLFDENRRVRAQKLRGVPSMGFYCPFSYLENLSKYCGGNGKDWEVKDFKIGYSFNNLGNLVISTKYIPKGKPQRSGSGNGPIVRKPSRYIKEQFKEHFDTTNLFRNVHKIPIDKPLIVTWKLHGTSLRCGNVLVKRNLSLLERLSRFLGAKILETEYDFIVGSRTVIKDPKAGPGFYNKDIWGKVSSDLFKDKLHKGEMIYGEIVGYVPDSDSLIQKGYTYGCAKGTYNVYIYRITNTNIDGITIDLTWDQIVERCSQLMVKTVPYVDVIYRDSEHNTTDEWFINYIRTKYLETDCHLQFSMPEEGICIRVDSLIPEIYKAKSFRFLELETKQLDNGEVDVETNES